MIETVKWQWADAVKNKKVYRDYELIRSKTKEEALEAIDYLFTKTRNMSYTITVFKDEEYLTYNFKNMPCLGGLVKYKDTHGDKYFMNPYFPRDIPLAFPEGDVVFLGFYRPEASKIPDNPYTNFLLSEESPWITGFGHRDTIILKETYMVFTNMNTDPTVLYSLLSMSGLRNGDGWEEKHITHPKAKLLHVYQYNMDPRRFAGQKPHKISGGTWAEGFGYTRPYNGSIFKTSLPLTLDEFGKLSKTGPTPEANQSPKYFIQTMKEKFNVDATKPSPELNDALVEAWDYFKEQSKELEG